MLYKILTISKCNPNATWTARNTRHAANGTGSASRTCATRNMVASGCLGELHGWTANNNTLSGGTISIPRIYRHTYVHIYVVSVCVAVRSAWFATMRDICANRANPGTHTAHHYHHDILYALLSYVNKERRQQSNYYALVNEHCLKCIVMPNLLISSIMFWARFL